MTGTPSPGGPTRPTGFARVWEAGRIGAPTRGAAWARCAVTVLVTLAERPEEIDVARVEAARHDAEEQMRHPVSVEDGERARIAMLGAITRLRVAERARMRRG